MASGITPPYGGETGSEGGQAVGSARNRYALAVLASIYMCNLLDRGLMDLLAQPIKEDLHLSDTQLGFLTGMAFALFYATFGLPLARWADRGNRVTIASLAIGLWSITVMACVLVTNYAQLVLARMAAAVGEAGCKPPTYSLVGDYFPGPAERIRAMSFYWLGGPVAILVSSIAGGWLNERVGWRMTFFLMGLPGLVLSVLVRLTLRDPRKPALISRLEPRLRPPSLKAVFNMLWRRASCRHLIIALILLFTMIFGLGSWSAAFLMRTHGFGTAELGLWLGLILGFGGAASVLIGGYVTSRWFADNEQGQMRFCAISIALTVPCYVAFLTVSHKYLALIMQVPLTLVMTFFIAPTYALIQRLVPDDIRAITMAIIMFLFNLIGMGLGPPIVGMLSDSLVPLVANDSLRYAMLLMSFISLFSAYYFWCVGRTVREDLSAVERAERHRLEINGAKGTASVVT
jgi:MFS family permease